MRSTLRQRTLQARMQTKELISRKKSSVNGLDSSGTRQVPLYRWRRMAVQGFKGSHFNGEVKHGIISPLRPMNQFTPRCRLVRNKTSKVVLQSSINNFCLTIGLRMHAELRQRVLPCNLKKDVQK